MIGDLFTHTDFWILTRNSRKHTLENLCRIGGHPAKGWGKRNPPAHPLSLGRDNCHPLVETPTP